MKRVILVALWTSLTSLCQADDYRVFKNNKEQEIDAKIIAINADVLRLERKDGKVFNVSKATFSKADQEYIKKWQEDHVFSDKDSLKVSTSLMKGPVETTHEGVTYTDGTYEKKGLEVRTYDAYYRIELENTTKYVMENIRVEYLFLKRDLRNIRDGSKDKGELIGGVGSVLIDALPSREKRKFDTGKLPIIQENLKIGYKGDGTDNKKRDDVEGIHVRVYSGDRLLVNYPNPKSMDEYDWKDFPNKLDLTSSVSGE